MVSESFRLAFVKRNPGTARSLAPVDGACVFCGGAPDSPEHVYPQWFLKIWDDTGPFTVEINGEPLRARSGQPVTSAKMWRIMLQCYGICNGDLDRLFEKPAKDPVRVLMRDVRPLDDQVAVLNAARWVVKTLALAAHPAANHTAFASRTEKGKKGRNGPWEEYPRAVLDSIKVGDIPADMSLWVAVTDPSTPGLPDPPFEEVFLRRTSRADGRGGSGETRTTGFGLADGRVALFQLVYHPLHDLEHPFEPDGLVTRLWPDPPVRFDVRGHPVLNHRTRLAHVFADGLFDHGLELGERSVGNGPPWSDW